MRWPRQLGAFAKLVSDARSGLSLTWTDPCPLLNVNRGARESLLPFARLGDGGVVALWLQNGEQRVVHCDSEGQHAVVAVSFADFLARLARPRTALLDRLELDGPLDTARLAPATRPRRIPASLQRELARWLDSHSLSARPSASKDALKVARELRRVAARMLEDGLSKVYRPRDPHWSVELRLAREGTAWSASYLDFGKWYPVPRRYRLQELALDLVPLLKDPRKRRFELSISKDGNVYADRGNQLAIEP